MIDEESNVFFDFNNNNLIVRSFLSEFANKKQFWSVSKLALNWLLLSRAIITMANLK